MTYSEMTEENRKAYDRAFGAAKDIETVACYLLGDIGYWGEDDTPDEDRLEMAERHLARLRALSEEMALALADMRRIICGEEKEVIHVD